MKSYKAAVAQMILTATMVAGALGTGSARARGGDSFDNGGGAAERLVLLAYAQLENPLRICLQAESCRISADERKILEDIQAGLPQEYAAVDQVQFASELTSPGTFIIDGELKMAKTGTSPGTPIFVNTDLLTVKNSAGAYEAISYAEAVAILIHEMGHHYGIRSHKALDLLGVKVAIQLGKNIQTTPLLSNSRDVTMTVINDDRDGAFPTLILKVYDDVVNFSDTFRDQTRCPVIQLPVPFHPLPDITLVSRAALGASLMNIHWGDVSNDHSDRIDFILDGNVELQCDFRSTVGRHDRNYKSRIFFSAYLDGTTWRLDQSSLGVKQYTGAWWKILNLPFMPN